MPRLLVFNRSSHPEPGARPGGPSEEAEPPSEDL